MPYFDEVGFEEFAAVVADGDDVGFAVVRGLGLAQDLAVGEADGVLQHDVEDVE